VRIRRNGGHISIRDRVGPFWALGLFLLAGGLVAVAMPLGPARQVRWLAFDDLESVEVDQGTDSEGGTVWRPAVRLRGGQLVLLSELWSHDQAEVEESVSVVAEACRLPTRSFPADAQATRFR